MSGWIPELRADALASIRTLIAADLEGAAAAGLAVDGIDDARDDLRAAADAMRETHERHVDDLNDILADRGLTWPRGRERPLARLLSGGVTAVAMVFGTRATLGALLRVEERVRALYVAACAIGGAPDSVLDVIAQGLDDQRRHTALLARSILSLGDADG